MIAKAENILKKHQLRHTECREEVLNVFENSETALSHGDLEDQVNHKFDRVTIYRTLKTFLEKGLLHKILDSDGSTRYALCNHDQCSQKEHHHDHVHFKCNQCGNTTCLESVHIPEISLPNGYLRAEINMLVQGQCPTCR